MDFLLLLFIVIGLAFLLWKQFFSQEKTNVKPHYRIVKKKIPVQGYPRKKPRTKGRSKRKK